MSVESNFEDLCNALEDITSGVTDKVRDAEEKLDKYLALDIKELQVYVAELEAENEKLRSRMEADG